MVRRKKSERSDETERPSVDWIEGDKRNAVHLGARQLDAVEEGGDANDAGIEVGDADETPDAVSAMSEAVREE